MICPHCSFNIEQDAPFCPKCGKPLNVGTQSAQQNYYQAGYNQSGYKQSNQRAYQAQSFCKNCGHQVMPGAIVCTNCGVAVGNGNNFCPNCGIISAPQAVVCTSCGGPLIAGEAQKSRLAAGLFGIFLGGFGVHNFYLGYTSKAVIQLVATIVGYLTMCITIGFVIVPGIAIWGLIEGIMILTGAIAADGNGFPLKD